MRGGTNVFKKRVKKKWRQTVWLNDEQLEILQLLQDKTGANKADLLRWGLSDLARNQGVIDKDWPKR